jgi:hypothetical protein
LIFSDRALARRLERAEGRANADFVEAAGAAFPERQATWTEFDGTFAMFDGVGSPVTQTFALGLDGAVTPAHFDRVERFFFERQSPVDHEISPLADVSVWGLLGTRTYQLIELTSVVWRSIDRDLRLAERPNPRVTVRPIQEDEHDMWARTAASGWSHLPELTGYLRDLGAINARRRNHVPFVAEIDGAPIAAGGLAIADGIAILAGASTVPNARRQGAQLALLEARLRHAASAGCDIAMMGASPGSDSQRNAERQGFRIAYTRLKWRLSPGA